MEWEKQGDAWVKNFTVGGRGYFMMLIFEQPSDWLWEVHRGTVRGGLGVDWHSYGRFSDFDYTCDAAEMWAIHTVEYLEKRNMAYDNPSGR